MESTRCTSTARPRRRDHQSDSVGQSDATICLQGNYFIAALRKPQTGFSHSRVALSLSRHSHPARK
eukprot:1597723-Prymnesium_polylepis.1